jgi:membrane-associated HD superfamily phosphohydrolase
LLELSNAEAPLLRKLAIETPGTNHHSFVVAMLAEAAAKAMERTHYSRASGACTRHR